MSALLNLETTVALECLEEHCPKPVDSEPASRWEKHLVAFLHRVLSFEGSHPFAKLLAIAVVIAGCGVCLVLGLPAMSTYGHDLFILLDGGWRVLSGQRPHVDFYSAFGPVTYLIAAAGLHLAHGTAKGMLYATVGVGLILGFWSTILASARLKAWSTLVFVSFVMMLWLAPFPIGEPYFLTSYAMQYNRLGYALLALLLLETFTTARDQNGESRLRWGSLSTGAIFATLLFLKLSFVIGAVMLVAAGLYLMRRDRWYALGLATGIVGVGLGYLLYLHWDVAAMIGDWQLAAHARTARLHGPGDVLRTVARNMTTIVSLSIFVGAATLLGRRQEVRRANLWTPLRLVLFGSVVVVADLLLGISNTQRAGFPLSVAAMIVIAGVLGTRLADQPRTTVQAKTWYSLILVSAVVLTLLPMASDLFNSWGVVLMRHIGRATTALNTKFDAPVLAQLRLDNHADAADDMWESNGAPYIDSVNEGMSLLRKYSAEDESVLCLCFSNPFSYGLQRPPAEGGATFFAYGTNYTLDAHPSPARILGDARLVIYPARPSEYDGVAHLLQICGSELAARYQPVARSDNWILLRRTGV
jgi:hypothetical protein